MERYTNNPETGQVKQPLDNRVKLSSLANGDQDGSKVAKKSFLPKKVKIKTKDSDVPESKPKPQPVASTKSVTKEEIEFHVIDERDELAYEEKAVNLMADSYMSNANRPPVFYERSMNDYSIHSREYHMRSQEDSSGEEDADMNPKYRTNTVQYITNATDMSDDSVPIITIKPPIDVNNQLNHLKKPDVKPEGRNFMKATQGSKVKTIDRSMSEKAEVLMVSQSSKPKNFIRMNKKNSTVNSTPSLEKNDLESIEMMKLRDAYNRYDFERSLRKEQGLKSDPAKPNTEDPMVNKKKTQLNTTGWKYSYKVEDSLQTLDETNGRTMNVEIIDGISNRSGDNKGQNLRISSNPVLPNLQPMGKGELEDRSIILKFETLFCSFKVEYDSLLAYCNDFNINLEDTVYSFEEFYRRFARLSKSWEEIKTFKTENRTSGNMAELGKYDATINNHDIQTREVIDLLDYLKGFSSSKVFYEKVIAKTNKKFFLIFDKNITPNFPLNLLSVYTLKFLVQLHDEFDFTLASLCKKPLHYFQIFMYIKKFLNDLKPKISGILKTNTQLAEDMGIVTEVTDFYFDFTQAFKKNEDKCNEIVKRYAKFPIRKNFYDKGHYTDFKKIKFNFNRDFS